MHFVKSIRVLIICVAMLGAVTFSGVASAQVSVEFSVDFEPPELPVYEQPLCPAEGYIWTPGYWAWDDYEGDYYWVPGTWVEAPEPGYLWTPGYWAYEGDRYRFHDGYWGSEVGFYGGINYGYGYTGRGYEGGRWEGRRFYYNRAVNNVNEREVHNVYEQRVQNNWNVPRVSYNGGRGVNERPTPREEAAARERRVARVPAQNQQIQQARTNRELRATENHGRPPIAATQRAGTFSGGGVVPAREGGRYNPPANHGGNNGNRGGNNANRPDNENRPTTENRPATEANRPVNEANRPANNNRGGNNRVENNNRPTYVHPSDLPRHTQPENPNANANANANRKYQQQQQQLNQRQEQEHQKLQQRQDQEHQRMAQQNANAGRQQQMEQRHQQQTQQMEQKHEQQQQRVQQRQQPQPQQQRQAPPPKEQKKPNERPQS